MPIEVAKTISIDARKTLIRHRDAIQTQFGVSIFFPRNTVRGAFQDMIIKGGVNATTKAERQIDQILIQWRQEFEAFKQRQAYRKNQRRIQQNAAVSPLFPTVAETVHTKNTSNPTSNNPFALLEDFEEPSQTQTTLPTIPTKSKKQVLKGWSTIAAKTPQPPKPTTTQSTKPNLSSKTFSAEPAQILSSTNIITQPFDWASAVDDEDDGDDVWDNW